ncbi:hypothetical protein NXT3_PB00052 (plasmid) [Sinorhizobium fredii]|uniref:Uncharacterized protein n=1 Tax=Rhizobium fredii TaxID=380 RepID=A0A2L0HBA1_RHIFR|nr:hypothetical protein NXT3_PB00052 [Sinorhizobium fredii]
MTDWMRTFLGQTSSGIESCWFNPLRAENWSSAVPTIQVARLSEIAVRLAGGWHRQLSQTDICEACRRMISTQPVSDGKSGLSR